MKSEATATAPSRSNSNLFLVMPLGHSLCTEQISDCSLFSSAACWPLIVTDTNPTIRTSTRSPAKVQCRKQTPILWGTLAVTDLPPSSFSRCRRHYNFIVLACYKNSNTNLRQKFLTETNPVIAAPDSSYYRPYHTDTFLGATNITILLL